MASTTDDLVEDVRSLARLPDAGDPDASGILRFADAEMVTLLAALVKDAQKEHWMVPEDIACDSVTSAFPLPRRALDRAYRKVSLVNVSGVETPCFEVPPGNPDTLVSFQRYYVQADELVFTKAPTAGYTLRIRARRRPSRLVALADCAPIDHAASTTSLVVTSAPAWLSALLVSLAPAYVDIVSGDSPHDLLYVDRITNGYAALALTLKSTTPIATSSFVNLTNIVNDRQDYICQRDTTCYPPLPEAAFPALVAGTARRVLESLGDPRVTVAQATYAERLKTAMDLISPRNDEGGRPIVNRNGGLRGGGGGYGRRVRW